METVTTFVFQCDIEMGKPKTGASLQAVLPRWVFVSVQCGWISILKSRTFSLKIFNLNRCEEAGSDSCKLQTLKATEGEDEHIQEVTVSPAAAKEISTPR